MRSFMLLLITFLTIFNTNTQAMNIQLAPQESKSLSNPTPITIHAHCAIKTNHTQDTHIMIHVMKHHSCINGIALRSGQKKSLRIHHDDHITVVAEPGSEVSIINQGRSNIQASCST